MGFAEIITYSTYKKQSTDLLDYSIPYKPIRIDLVYKRLLYSTWNDCVNQSYELLQEMLSRYSNNADTIKRYDIYIQLYVVLIYTLPWLFPSATRVN